ncbi:DNA topoisomerase I [Nitrincola tapanii]|uniref:DNA topoisomerase I n=1 Tax=Nitrincola tapanii TaxID=1708751 RepID=A0A5A9W737_9GAMM|nr:DNA topoisomerase I [Nitrincola tapanii]KAA0875829.1 DNA topoisomerase I [Nitrincola tapanii]
MLGDNLLYVILLAALGLAALLVNHVLTTREKDRAERNERLKWLKEQAEHTLNALSVLRELNCRSDITDKLNQHALSLIEEIGILAPESDLMSDISKVKESADRTRIRQEPLNNDKAVKRAQIYLNFAETLIGDMANKGRMSPLLVESYQRELYWINQSMVADAHQAQARALLDKGDRLEALTHLKHAKAILVRAAVPQRQKQERLNQVQALIDQLQPKRDYGSGTLADSLDAYLSEQK